MALWGRQHRFSLLIPAIEALPRSSPNVQGTKALGFQFFSGLLSALCFLPVALFLPWKLIHKGDNPRPIPKKQMLPEGSLDRGEPIAPDFLLPLLPQMLLFSEQGNFTCPEAPPKLTRAWQNKRPTGRAMAANQIFFLLFLLVSSIHAQVSTCAYATVHLCAMLAMEGARPRNESLRVATSLPSPGLPAQALRI